MGVKNTLLKLCVFCLLCFIICTKSYLKPGLSDVLKNNTNIMNDTGKLVSNRSLVTKKKKFVSVDKIKRDATTIPGKGGLLASPDGNRHSHSRLTESRVKAKTISRFGHYEGYSKSIYDEWIQTSQYITMRDGVKIAVDIVRPALDGKPVEEPLPLVWTHSRYHRGLEVGGKYYSWATTVKTLIRHGYIAASVDARGCGASFGRYEGTFSPAESRDAYELTEWFAAQPWCDGNIGMYGTSYLGITQFMAASQAPPHLKAIFPNMALFDIYNIMYPGGVFRFDFVETWGSITRELDISTVALPVEKDIKGKMRDEAIKDHLDNWDIKLESRRLKFRDGDFYKNGFFRHNPSENLDSINKSGIAVYQWNGWFDVFTRSACQWYANLDVPNKLTIGPWAHGSFDKTKRAERRHLTSIEQLRWFDYWLKGIDNGIMNEPKINYALMIEPDKWEWRSANTWPLPNEKRVNYYFNKGPSQSVQSVNDGLLSTRKSSNNEGIDKYSIDYSTTTGTSTRWDNGCGFPMKYPDMTENDRKGLTYTTPVLNEDIIIIGHPVITLYIMLTANDGDFYAFLEEIDEKGFSHYITEGVLRASHRSLSKAPYKNLGLPYHSHFREDFKLLDKNEPAALVFDLHPTSVVFNAGHRIRVTITCADKDNAEVRYCDRPTPVVSLYRNSKYPSCISLPVYSNN